MKQKITKGEGINGVKITLNIKDLIEIEHVAGEWKKAIENAKEFDKIELSFTTVLNISNFLQNILTNTESAEPSAFIAPDEFRKLNESWEKKY